MVFPSVRTLQGAMNDVLARCSTWRGRRAWQHVRPAVCSRSQQRQCWHVSAGKSLTEEETKENSKRRERRQQVKVRACRLLAPLIRHCSKDDLFALLRTFALAHAAAQCWLTDEATTKLRRGNGGWIVSQRCACCTCAAALCSLRAWQPGGGTPSPVAFHTLDGAHRYPAEAAAFVQEVVFASGHRQLAPSATSALATPPVDCLSPDLPDDTILDWILLCISSGSSVLQFLERLPKDRVLRIYQPVPLRYAQLAASTHFDKAASSTRLDRLVRELRSAGMLSDEDSEMKVEQATLPPLFWSAHAARMLAALEALPLLHELFPENKRIASFVIEDRHRKRLNVAGAPFWRPCTSRAKCTLEAAVRNTLAEHSCVMGEPSAGKTVLLLPAGQMASVHPEVAVAEAQRLFAAVPSLRTQSEPLWNQNVTWLPWEQMLVVSFLCYTVAPAIVAVIPVCAHPQPVRALSHLPESCRSWNGCCAAQTQMCAWQPSPCWLKLQAAGRTCNCHSCSLRSPSQRSARQSGHTCSGAWNSFS